MRRPRRSGAPPSTPIGVVLPARRIADAIAHDHPPEGIVAAAIALAREHGVECRGTSAIDGLEAALTRSGLDLRSENGEMRVRLPAGGPMAASLSPQPIRIAGATADLSITIEAGACSPLLAPVVGADWLWSGRRVRGPLTAAHVGNALAVSRSIGACRFSASGLFLSATDLPLRDRIAAVAHEDPRPLLVDTAGDVPVSALVAACRVARPAAAEGSSALIGLVRLEQSLLFGPNILAAIAALAGSGEAILLAPTLLLGATCPLAVTGALVRFATELLVGAAIARSCAPGVRLMAGVTVAEASMRTGLPQTGTALALTTLAGAIAVARRLGMPVAALGPPTARNGVDVRAVAETAAWLALALEADLVVGAFGAVELDAGISLEKMLIDADLAANLLGGTLDATPAADWARELAGLGPGGIALEAPSTRDRARTQQGRSLPDEALYETWAAAGEPDALEQATLAVTELLKRPALHDVTNVSRATIVRAIDDEPSPSRQDTVHRPARLNDLASSIYSAALRDAFGFKG